MLTRDELHQKVHEKMEKEQEKWVSWLLSQTPQEILNHAYEYCVRENILYAMENICPIEEKRAEALLSSPSIIAEIYDDFLDIETDFMSNLEMCIEERADKIIRSNRKEVA